MVERFVDNLGAISIASGESTVNGTGTAFAGHDLAGSRLMAIISGSPPVPVGTIAEVSPRGIYENLSLPLVSPYNGTTLADVAYELIDGPAIANGASQAALYARFVGFLEQNMGLVGNIADVVDYSLVPNNSLFVDEVTRVIYQWRNGVLQPVETVAATFNPRGAYDAGATYAKDDLVETGGYLFISNADANTGNAPTSSPSPASTSFWTYYPTAGTQAVLDALGVHAFIISEDQPSGGTDGDVWFVVSPA